MKVEVLKQFSVFLPNKPGALSALAGMLADKGVNILGIASEVRDDSGLVRLAVGESDEVSHILSKAGFASVETTLLSIEVADKAGELARITKVLADGKVNITTVYGTAIVGHSARILISVENAEKARALLAAAA
ncbi:MAG: ACT domain-containing protein [Elusimicrobia bacterium]|nr:ACT domain-containing protein [Elusimicrobiota bacterium]